MPPRARHSSRVRPLQPAFVLNQLFSQIGTFGWIVRVHELQLQLRNLGFENACFWRFIICERYSILQCSRGRSPANSFEHAQRAFRFSFLRIKLEMMQVSIAHGIGHGTAQVWSSAVVDQYVADNIFRLLKELVRLSGVSSERLQISKHSQVAREVKTAF